MWSNFSNEMDFLKSPFCYLLTLSVDWFQPFEHDVYSMGAIYLTIQNPPRNIRYKPENILLVGIMPGRKVSGFLSHTACLGCNKYLKRFVVGIGQSTDYSGYDRENWTLRTGQTHRSDVEEVLKETTKTGIAAAESRFGVRYSILLRLPLQ